MPRGDLDRRALTPLWADSAADEAEEARGAAVRAAVREHLTDKQREAVELFFFEGCSQGEIARRLGVSQQVVQRRIYGAERDGKRVGGALLRLRLVLAAEATPRRR